MSEMISFKSFLHEDQAIPNTVTGIKQLAMSYFNKASSDDDLRDVRTIALLNSALSMLALGNDAQTISNARRLVQLAVMKSIKRKDK